MSVKTAGVRYSIFRLIFGVSTIRPNYTPFESSERDHSKTGLYFALAHRVREIEHKICEKRQFYRNALNTIDFNMGPNVSPKSGTIDLA